MVLRGATDRVVLKEEWPFTRVVFNEEFAVQFCIKNNRAANFIVEHLTRNEVWTFVFSSDLSNW